MIASPYPSFLLCCRCSTCVLVDEAKGWHSFIPMNGTSLDVCPKCAAILLAVLRQTPDLLEET